MWRILLLFLFVPILANSYIFAQETPIIQNDLEILFDELTPTSPPTDNEFILELNQVFENSKEQSENTYLTTLEKELFEKQGYVERIFNDGSNFQLEIKKNILTFNQFNDDFNQEEETTINIHTQARSGYQVFIQNIQDLNSTGYLKIAKTSCDVSSPCSVRKANLWTKDSPNSGWGFNVAGKSVVRDFLTNEHFRPISDTEKSLIALSNSPENIENIKLKVRISVPERPESIFIGKIIIISLPF